MPVWDPEFVLEFKHTGTQGRDTDWIAPPYELAPDEAVEVYRIEVYPPVDATTKTVKKLRQVTIRVDDKDYETIVINSVMMPGERPDRMPIAIDLGVPYLWRPITGRLPTPFEGTCPKAARSKRITVKTIAEEDIAQDYRVVLKCARVKGEGKLVEVLGTSMIDASFSLDADSYHKTITVSMDNFNALPGGLNQTVPRVMPWIVYARNAKATTPNQWYEFKYPDSAERSWMTLSWNLYEKAEAYIVKAIGVIPHANAKALRFNVVGRELIPEFPIRTDLNFFPPALTYSDEANATLFRHGPKFLAKPYLFHGVKGGIEVIDNGTSIPAGGVELHVYGVKLELRA